MSVEKRGGVITISLMVGTHLIIRRYFFYSVKEAKRQFNKEIKELEEVTK